MNETRPVFYLGSSKKDLEKLPPEVKKLFARCLEGAAEGETPEGSKVLKGFGG